MTQTPQVFISYSRKDEEFVLPLARRLSDKGVQIWIDVDSIPIGVKWDNAIQQGLAVCSVMTLIISPNSVHSRNVEDEWQYFRDRDKPIIPILYRRIEEEEKHYQLYRINHIDVIDLSFEAAFNKVEKALAANGILLETKPTQTIATMVDAQAQPKPLADVQKPKIPQEVASSQSGLHRLLRDIQDPTLRPIVRGSFSEPKVFCRVTTPMATEVEIYRFPSQQNQYKSDSIPGRADIGIVGRTQSTRWYYVTYVNGDGMSEFGWIPKPKIISLELNQLLKQRLEITPVMDYKTLPESDLRVLISLLQDQQPPNPDITCFGLATGCVGIVAVPLLCAYLAGLGAVSVAGETINFLFITVPVGDWGRTLGFLLGFIGYAILFYLFIIIPSADVFDKHQAIETELELIQRAVHPLVQQDSLS